MRKNALFIWFWLLIAALAVVSLASIWNRQTGMP
jgi:hypothetical protein